MNRRLNGERHCDDNTGTASGVRTMLSLLRRLVKTVEPLWHVGVQVCYLSASVKCYKNL